VVRINSGGELASLKIGKVDVAELALAKMTLSYIRPEKQGFKDIPTATPQVHHKQVQHPILKV
jgi:hypothetical protein